MIERVDKTQSGVKVPQALKEAATIDVSQEQNPVGSLESSVIKRKKKIKVDTGTYAKARDQSTEPMVGEKSTDPKMRDKETGAWKRDTKMQTSVRSM